MGTLIRYNQEDWLHLKNLRELSNVKGNPKVVRKYLRLYTKVLKGYSIG